MVIATRADVDTRSIVRLPDADTSKKGYKFTDPDGEFPRVVPLPVQGDICSIGSASGKVKRLMYYVALLEKNNK